MSAHALPPCPYLPTPPAGLNHRHLSRHGEVRDGAFYLSCLEYGHDLWQRGQAARAVLCLDRAMGADLRGTEPELALWPMPYAAMAWFLTHTPPDIFIGNPRVHFQHYADRVHEPRRATRSTRAWACWALTRRLRPEWTSDPKHQVVEPSENDIATQLGAHGLPDETQLWRAVLHASTPSHFSPKFEDIEKSIQNTLDRSALDSTVRSSSPSRGGSSAG